MPHRLRVLNAELGGLCSSLKLTDCAIFYSLMYILQIQNAVASERTSISQGSKTKYCEKGMCESGIFRTQFLNGSKALKPKQKQTNKTLM